MVLYITCAYDLYYLYQNIEENRMKIIISPAKKMVIDTDSLMPKDMPKYISES